MACLRTRSGTLVVIEWYTLIWIEREAGCGLSVELSAVITMHKSSPNRRSVIERMSVLITGYCRWVGISRSSIWDSLSDSGGQ